MAGQDFLDGRYRLLRLIGRGGMGAVHEARDCALERRVAIKILSAATDFTGSGILPERFRREARGLARIMHPSVVTIHDFGVHEGTPYLVMELLDGLDLHRLVTEAGPLDPAIARHIGAQMLLALRAAHTAGVLHRDVKPSNVHVTLAGRVVLQDFGLARLRGDTAITSREALVGTPQYMAPELIRGDRPTEASDFYALGLCLYWMLTGEPPLGNASDLGVLVERAVDGGVPSLRERRPDLPADLAELVDRLAGPDPDARLPLVEEEDPFRPPPGAASALASLLRDRVRRRAVDTALRPLPAPESSHPEYLDHDPMPAGSATPLDTPFAGDVTPAPRPGVSLSDATRRLVMSTMSVASARTRLREAVNLVQRGEVQEAVQILATVTQVCNKALGAEDPTTLASQYWQAVCLARLGAGGEALALLSKVSARTERERHGGDG